MRRLIVATFVAALTFAGGAFAAPPWPENTDGTPSVLDPSIPLSYVGNDASVSLGVNAEGETEGQLMGVFGRNNTRATVAQLWWDRAGAGGFQADFNWLWGFDPIRAREHPEQATVARLSFALDQNSDHDRKATVGFGIERREYSLEAYLSGGVSSARRSDTSLANTQTTIQGSDELGDFTQVETTSTESIFDRKPYGAELGFQASHFFEGTSMRLHGGASYQDGDDGASANTFSVGLDTPLGTRGWGLSALAEHVTKHGSLDGDANDDRLAVFLRYEFGARGSFAPTNSLEDPAWISRAIARPSSAHPRVVESYRTKKKENVTTTRSPKNYTNHFPTAQNDSASVTGNDPVTIQVLANDSDPDHDPLSITAVTQPAHGVASIAGGAIVYQAVSAFTGTDTFRYTISDGHGGTASADVSVAIGAAPNRPPQAIADNAATSFGQPVTIRVLANDSDPDGNALTIVSVTQPASGSVSISEGNLVFTPSPGFAGIARFTYTIDDGHGATSSAQVTVNVAAQPNRPPVAADDTATTAFATPVTIDVLANDSDVDRGDTLAIVSVSPPANGTATISGNSIIYTPAPTFAGTDRFTYTISDGHGGSATAGVTVTVSPRPNRPPVAVDDAATTAFQTPIAINVLANDSDPDGDPLAISGVTTPANGAVSASGGTITYTPANGFSGIDRFTYSIDDGRGGTATANVTVTVGARPNQLPIANNDAATTVSGTPVTITVLANDSDPDGDPLTLQSVTTPGFGSAAISGTVIVYTPAAGVVGTDTFNYTINDGRGGTATATVTVTVTPPPNQPPTAFDDAATTAFATPVTIDAIANDSDPDGDALTIVSVMTPIGGTAVINNNRIDYAPSRAFSGLDTFAYTISDGHGHTATANISVDVLPIPRPR